jgi:hypothetical protein
MTEQELEILLDEMYAYFGELPSPEHEPKRFRYYVKLYKYYKSQK